MSSETLAISRLSRETVTPRTHFAWASSLRTSSCVSLDRRSFDVTPGRPRGTRPAGLWNPRFDNKPVVRDSRQDLHNWFRSWVRERNRPRAHVIVFLVIDPQGVEDRGEERLGPD